MYNITREFRRHSNYFYYAFRNILRFDVLPSWALGVKARVFCLVVVGVLFVVFIGVTGAASGSGYKMNELEKQVAGLKKEIQKNEVRIAEYNSMDSLEERIKESGLVLVNDIKYINQTGAEVAKR